MHLNMRAFVSTGAAAYCDRMAQIGKSELDIFPIVLGGNVFGWTADQAASFGVLDAFIDGGGDLIDTADGYSHWAPGNSGGESETIIGAWMAARHNRDRVLIASKVGTKPDRAGLRAANIRAAVDDSLTRLGTDHIDLYYAHFDDPEAPMAEIVSALSGLVDAGKVRYIAPSNFSPARLDEWADVTSLGGWHAPVALQPEYNLMQRAFETNGLRDAAIRHGLGVLPYLGLANGFLTGKYRPGVEVESERAGRVTKYLDARGMAVLDVLNEVADAHSVKPAAVALAWLREQPTVVAPIASASKPEQVGDLLEGGTLQLEASEMAALVAAAG